MKDLCYATLGRLSVINLVRYRLGGQVVRLNANSDLFLHLGSGRHRIDGFLNIDGNPLTRPDLWLDLRLGLPFPDASVGGIYCCHTLEHFHEKDARRILGEAFRVLKPGRGARIVTPHLGKAIEAYVRGDAAWFNEFPDRRRSLGGRLNNYLLCRDQHRLMFDRSFFEEILGDIGFVHLEEATPHRSRIFDPDRLASFEYESPREHRSLFIEAFKPGAAETRTQSSGPRE